MSLDPVTLLAALTIAAFAIDRTVAALFFLLAYVWRAADPSSLRGEARAKAERSSKLVYMTIAGALALAVWYFGHLSVFTALKFPAHPILDAFVTVLVLAGGSDRISELLKAPGEGGGASKPEPEPIRIAGTVTLVNDAAPATGEKKTAAGG
jgi:hypothetical protein